MIAKKNHLRQKGSTIPYRNGTRTAFLMIIDATPQTEHTVSTWWQARTPKLSVSYRGTKTDRPARTGTLDQALALFHAGHITQALPAIGSAACAGDARACYVLATALFNGDGVVRDWPTALSLMQMAHDGGIAQAAESLVVMKGLIPTGEQDARETSTVSLLSADAVTQAARALTRLRSPDPIPGSLAGTVLELMLPLLRQRLERLLPETIEREVAVVLARIDGDQTAR